MELWVRRLVLAIGILISAWSSAARSAELPQFQGYCEEVSQRQITPLERFTAYVQCSAIENRTKAQLEKHWSLVTDEDMKICMRYKGTQDEIRSYPYLMMCLSQLIGAQCYSGKLSCGGIPL